MRPAALPAQVLRYETGQFYKVHHDQNSPVTSAWGPRMYTFFMYLSDDASLAGGETHFSRLGLSVAPRAGTALVFFPGFLCGTPDALTVHSAEPAGGEKWVAQLWVRQHQLHAENKVSALRPRDVPVLPMRLQDPR